MAAAKVFWPDKQLWCGNQDLSSLDMAFSRLLPLSELPLKQHEGDDPEAIDVARGIKDNLETIILATVHCPGWRKSWIQSFVMTVITQYMQCSYVMLQSVKGGAATDCEINFIEEVMPLMGFTVAYNHGKPAFRTSASNWTGKAPFTEWRWEIQRPGAKPFMVNLYQYQDADNLPVEFVEIFAWAFQDQSKAPNLRRVAVVSCPLKGLPPANQLTHDILNKKLAEGLDRGLERATTKGWKG